MRAIFLLLLAVFGVDAMAAQAPGRFSLNLGDGETYSFEAISKVQGLRTLYGAYEEPMSTTAGTALHIFPNHRFTVISWCDICPRSLVAKGSYTYKDGVLSFTYTRRYENTYDFVLPKELIAFHGWIQKEGYVTGSEFVLIRPEEVGSARSNADFQHYLRQRIWYPDWQSMYEEESAEK